MSPKIVVRSVGRPGRGDAQGVLWRISALPTGRSARDGRMDLHLLDRSPLETLAALQRAGVEVPPAAASAVRAIGAAAGDVLDGLGADAARLAAPGATAMALRRAAQQRVTGLRPARKRSFPPPLALVLIAAALVAPLVILLLRRRAERAGDEWWATNERGAMTWNAAPGGEGSEMTLPSTAAPTDDSVGPPEDAPAGTGALASTDDPVRAADDGPVPTEGGDPGADAALGGGTVSPFTYGADDAVPGPA